jgi:hypothetical protein
MTDRLERRGGANERRCPLCRCIEESACRLLLHCRYSVWIWGMIKNWLGLYDFDPSSWVGFEDVESWWSHLFLACPGRRKAMASLVILVS